MIDIHTHVLPEVDDGAQSLEEACAMVEMAAADGITQVVATPHCNARYPFSLERNRTLRAELVAATAGRLTLSYGCDFHLSYENLERVLAEPSTFTINQRNYLLVEFAEYGKGARFSQERIGRAVTVTVGQATYTKGQNVDSMIDQAIRTVASLRADRSPAGQQ